MPEDLTGSRHPSETHHVMNSLEAQDAAPPSTPAVEIRGLHVVRGGRVALDRLDATVARGCITGLLGPSGCGKSTLMRAIVGTQKTAGGEVRVLGRPAGSPDLRHRLGYVTQAPSVYADLSVIENLRYFAAVIGAPKGDPVRVVGEVGLRGRERDAVGRLSGGQRARVSLAAALLGTPELLVLDEPTVGLDPVLRKELWGLFGRLAASGATLLVSSHVMDEAAHCDRLLLMRDGAIIADDSPGRLLASTGTTQIEDAFLSLVGGTADSGSAEFAKTTENAVNTVNTANTEKPEKESSR
jgi:ABC-2 type transport system ATP-binding protein